MKTYTTVSEIEAEAARSDLYVRWDAAIGRSIKRGYSINHQTGAAEAGLSVNGLSGRDREWVGTHLVEYEHLGMGTRPYLLRGTHAGTGSDGEDVLTNVTIVGAVSPQAIAEAKAISDQRLRTMAMNNPHLSPAMRRLLMGAVT